MIASQVSTLVIESEERGLGFRMSIGSFKASNAPREMNNE